MEVIRGGLSDCSSSSCCFSRLQVQGTTGLSEVKGSVYLKYNSFSKVWTFSLVPVLKVRFLLKGMHLPCFFLLWPPL